MYRNEAPSYSDTSSFDCTYVTVLNGPNLELGDASSTGAATAISFI